MDFFETDEAMRPMFNTDWTVRSFCNQILSTKSNRCPLTVLHPRSLSQIARSAHGLGNFIKQMQKEGMTALGSEIKVPDAELLEAEVDETREVIWKHHALLYGSFDYYTADYRYRYAIAFPCQQMVLTVTSVTRECRAYSAAPDKNGEVDIHSLSFNGYLAFAREAGFISKFCPASLLEVIFKTVNVDNDVVTEKLSQVVISNATLFCFLT